MASKEFLSRFSRHLIMSAGKIEKPEAKEAIKKEIEIKEKAESEEDQAEALLKTAPFPPEPAAKPEIIRPVQEVTVPAPRISEEEKSLRKELEKARERVMGRAAAKPAPVAHIPQKAPQPEKIEAALDLGKLNIFIKNPEVTAIECNGPNMVLVIKKGAQSMTTTTTLSSQEIEDIIKKFSDATKTEIAPLFKTTFGDMTIITFISSIIGTRFLISRKK